MGGRRFQGLPRRSVSIALPGVPCVHRGSCPARWARPGPGVGGPESAAAFLLSQLSARGAAARLAAVPALRVMFKGRAGEDHLCGRCGKQPPAFFMARAAFVYDRALVDVIHCFKYKGNVQLAAPLGRLLLQAYVRFWEDERVDAILPVPLYGRRLRGRGFNQAELLVRRWETDPDRLQAPPILSGVLRRVKATAPQAGLGRRSREANIRGAFAVRRPEAIAGGHLLLVDDVITTGATAAECAAQLLEGGAARVDVLALARVI